MDIREYILTGIVESYVLGLASEQERAEFEQLCLRHPELVAARNDFEEKLEKKALEQAIAPPADIKEKLLTEIRAAESPAQETKIVSMNSRPRRVNFSRWVAAAAVLLLLVSSWFAYNLYSKNNEMEISMNDTKAKLDSMNVQMEEYKKMMDVMSKPGIAVVSMVGTQPSTSSADIYWDSTSKDVYMVVKNMPKLPSEKQYQLWAFIDKKPVDLGLFDMDKERFFLKMKNVQQAEAFAITIENRGNGDIPKGPMETYGRRL